MIGQIEMMQKWSIILQEFSVLSTLSCPDTIITKKQKFTLIKIWYSKGHSKWQFTALKISKKQTIPF